MADVSVPRANGRGRAIGPAGAPGTGGSVLVGLLVRGHAAVTRRRRHRPAHRPLFARFYANMSRLEDRVLEARRRQLLGGLQGHIAEVGAGNGLNFAHYPAGVTRVVALEPEPRLRCLALRASQRAGVPITVVSGLAESLPFDDNSFDAVVSSLVLCSVHDPTSALSELRRILRPGGELRFLEHIQADRSGLRLAQRVVDATFWPTLLGGCNTGRDTVRAIQEAHFRVGPLEHFHFPAFTIPIPSSPHVIGTAVRCDLPASRGTATLDLDPPLQSIAHAAQ